jgi:hypothetical protein
MRTFYNVFPKSGTHIVILHCDLLHKHIGMFNDSGVFKTEGQYIRDMQDMNGDFTGHVPYYPLVDEWLHNNNIRTIYIHRDLRDTALSLSEYIKVNPKSEFNITVGGGKRLSEQSDILSDCIRLVGAWNELFSPWLTKADAVYTFEELRGAALLLGRENESVTFRTGQKGAWRYKYDPHHKRLAEEVFSERG